MSIKVGDFVYINKNSGFYGLTSKNPKDKIGVVKIIYEYEYENTLVVDWGDCENTYPESDLVVVTLGKSVLSKLLVEPFKQELSVEVVLPHVAKQIKISFDKICKHCKEILPLEKFSKSQNSESGYFPYCKCCVESLQSQHKKQYDDLYS